MIWKEKPLTSGKKGSWAQGSHVVWETADQYEKGIVGSSREKSPKSNFRNGGNP